MSERRRSMAWMLILMLCLSGCTPGPRDLVMGEEECAHCRMMLTDEQFASQVVMNQGRTWAFDSIECMVAYVALHDAPEEIHSMWVPDHANPDQWLDVREAYFLQSETLSSPMGLSLSAHGTETQALDYRDQFGGELLQWEALRPIVVRAWDLNR